MFCLDGPAPPEFCFAGPIILLLPLSSLFPVFGIHHGTSAAVVRWRSRFRFGGGGGGGWPLFAPAYASSSPVAVRCKAGGGEWLVPLGDIISASGMKVGLGTRRGGAVAGDAERLGAGDADFDADFLEAEAGDADFELPVPLVAAPVEGAWEGVADGLAEAGRSERPPVDAEGLLLEELAGGVCQGHGCVAGNVICSTFWHGGYP